MRISNYPKLIGSFIARYSFEVSATNDDAFGYNDIDYCSAVRSSGTTMFGNYYLQFDGVDDYLRIDDISNNERDITFTAESFTIEVWINATTIEGSKNYAILYKGDSSTIYYELYLSGNGKSTYFGMRLGTGWTQWISSPTNSIQTNTLYHITAIWDENMKKMSLYINGQIVDYYRSSSSTASAIDPSTTGLYIGYSPHSSRDYYSGLIDEVVIFNYPKYLHNDIDGDTNPDVYEAESGTNLYDSSDW